MGYLSFKIVGTLDKRYNNLIINVQYVYIKRRTTQIADILQDKKSKTEIQNTIFGLATCICSSHIQGFILLKQLLRPVYNCCIKNPMKQYVHVVNINLAVRGQTQYLFNYVTIFLYAYHLIKLSHKLHTQLNLQNCYVIE